LPTTTDLLSPMLNVSTDILNIHDVD
jgi:hypothetical protein